jgi:hypothetical protein
MNDRQSTTLEFGQILDDISPLLLRRSQDRHQLHRRKVEELHQNLANRGIDIAFEPVMSQFIDMCRLHIEYASVPPVLAAPRFLC